MPNIQLSDQIFATAQQRAQEGGYLNVDEYVAAVIREDSEITPDLEHLFTPERMQIIDRAAAELDAGRGMTSEQLDERIATERQAWSNR